MFISVQLIFVLKIKLMLNSIIIFILNSFEFFEKISDGSMAGQYYAQHSEDIE